MALLKELPSISGKVNVRGRISYVSQEPWVFSGTIRQNILFGKDYEATRYKRIIRVCALEKVTLSRVLRNQNQKYMLQIK